MKPSWSRRAFVRGLTLAGAMGPLGRGHELAAAEPPPETTRIRFPVTGAVCIAPQYVADDLLRAEGFTDVQYVRVDTGTPALRTLATGKADAGLGTAGQLVMQLDAGDPLVLLAGIHVGCYELIGSNRIRSVSDLKGRSVAVPSLVSGHYFILAAMLAHIGLDPRRDVKVTARPTAESAQLLAEGRIDALVAFPPEPQDLRARKIGHVVVSTIEDRPWSQYFCCLFAANREFARKYPVATKRALRATLKAAVLCAREPERTARLLVDRGYTERYEHALQTLKDIPYTRWRDYNPEDTVRFYALRLHEAGMIKANPKKLIATGTDWRLFTELKKELKA